MAPIVDDVDNESDDEPSRIVSVFADSSRKNRWTIARRTSMITAFARSYFDFRHVEVDGDTVEINVVCLLGKVTFVVPDGTDVQLSGVSFLASATSEVAAPGDDAGLPRLVVNANTFLGRLRVRTPDEAERGLSAPVDEPVMVAAGAAPVESAPGDAADAAAPAGDATPELSAPVGASA